MIKVTNDSCWRNTHFIVVSLLVILFSAANGTAQASGEEVQLGGEITTSEKVSGFRGTRKRLILDNDLHAIDGISAAEGKDNPCWIRISTENINDSARDGEARDMCGGKATSRKIKAVYRDNMKYGERVFVTGIRVCTNGKQNRVKGFQLSGKQILPDGQLGMLKESAGSDQYVTMRLVGGGSAMLENIEFGQREKWRNDPENPADLRNNCKEWQNWASCPEPNQLATGIVAHFEAGKEPRSVTGIELLCRSVWSTNGVGATRKS